MTNNKFKTIVEILPGKTVRYRYSVINKETGKIHNREGQNGMVDMVRDDKRVFIAMTSDAMTCFSTQAAIDKYLAMAERKNKNIDNPNWKFDTEIAYVEQ